MDFTLACTTCAKAFHAAGGNAAGLAILFLLIVIVSILGMVGFLMARMMRREQENLDPRYQDDFTPQSSQ